MIEITVGSNLVQNERESFPALHPLRDLSEDLVAARKLITLVDRFFLLDPCVTYSGMVRKLDDYDGQTGAYGPYIYAQVWNGDKLHRTVAFKDVGYVGIVHVQSPEDDSISDNMDRDLIGNACNAIEDGLAESVIGYVADGRLELAIPYPRA
jgi:hypothetical protein